MGLLSISYVIKNLQLSILLHSFSHVQFLEQFPSPSLFPLFFLTLPQPHFHKPYLQSKTFCNISGDPSSPVFCSNAVPITPSSSIHFFRFVKCATKCPYYHWKDPSASNVLRSFDFSLQFLVSLNFFLLFFTISYLSRCSNIIMAQL